MNSLPTLAKRDLDEASAWLALEAALISGNDQYPFQQVESTLPLASLRLRVAAHALVRRGPEAQFIQLK
jgi:hypothetical protein